MELHYAQSGRDQSVPLGVSVAKHVALLPERNATAARDNGRVVRRDRLERIAGRTVAPRPGSRFKG